MHNKNQNKISHIIVILYVSDYGGNKKVKQFLDKLYINSTIYLDRKYERYLNLCNILHGRLASKETS